MDNKLKHTWSERLTL